MTLDIDDAPSKDEILLLQQKCRLRERMWRKRAINSIVAFLLSCASLYPFLEGHFLHAYWDILGKYLDFLSMTLLLVAVYCSSLWWGARGLLRDTERTCS
jgi:hypothetical protein